MGLILASGGAAAALALVPPGHAQEPPPTTAGPTVPPPTEPPPTVPAPTPTVPAPPPVRLTPVVTAPSTRLAPAPPPAPSEIVVTVESTQAPVSRPSPARSSGYVGPRQAPQPSYEPAANAQPVRPAARRVARPRAFEATVHRTSRRVSVRFAVVIPKSGRAFLIVRGPAPGCQVAGVVPVRGRRGASTVFFAGRVHGRRLDPGVYRISLSPSRRLAAGAPTEAVRVVSPRRSVPLAASARTPACARSLPAAAPKPRVRKAAARPAPRAVEKVSASPASDEADAAVEAAGAALPVGGVLGEATGEAETNPFAGIAMLVLIGGLLLAMAALVTKFFRGSWNP